MASKVWPIESATRYIQEHHLVLHYDKDRLVDLWTPFPSVEVPISLRRSVVKLRAQLLQWMREARIEVCQSPNLHKQAWQLVGPSLRVCKLCWLLDRSVAEEGNISA